MSITKVHRSFVSLHLPVPVPALLTFARSVVLAMTGNANFTTPVRSLAIVIAAVTALEAAETAALARTKGAVLLRNEKKVALVALLQQLKGYVQSEADANVENGSSIIGSAGMAVRKAPVRKPRVFTVKPGKVSGSADLVTAAAVGKRGATNGSRAPTAARPG